MIGIENYIQVGSVKSAWITLYILSIVLGVLYMVKPLSDDSRNDTTGDIEDSNKTSGSFWKRLGNSYNAVRDNCVMLLISLTLNGFGVASTKALSILSWIFFVVTILYAVAVLFVQNKIIRVIFNLIFFVLTLIMSSLAFKSGW